MVTAEQASNVWFNRFDRIVEIYFKFCTRFVVVNVCKGVFWIFFILFILFSVAVEVRHETKRS